MNSGRSRGLIAIVTGLFVVVIAGIILSFLSESVLSLNMTITIGIIIFLLVSPLLGYGIYTYARHTQDVSTATNDEMQKPRQLLDILRHEEQMDVTILASQLDVPLINIKNYIDDLSQLELFAGMTDWHNGKIQLISPQVLQSIQHCHTCASLIEIHQGITQCQNCQTEYHLP